MTLAKLRALERSLFRLRKSLEATKSDPDCASIYAYAEKEWLRIYDVYKKRALAAAEKRDGGVVLFTVFRPEHKGRAVSETVRTPNRILYRTAWKHYCTGELEPWKEFSGDVPGTLWSADYDFKRLMQVKEAA